jgi:hypothetical protein
MSDQDEPTFDDPAFDDVRELLADARVTEPIPDDVAARLDATLVSLQAERSATQAASRSVVPLRHRVGRILVAAAAVVVIGAGGVGIAQLGLDGSGSNDDSAATSAREDSGGGDSGAPESADGLAVSPEVPGALIRNGVARLSHATFAQDAARVMVAIDVLAQRGATEDDAAEDLADAPPSGYAEAPPVTATPQSRIDGEQVQDCAGPDAADAILVPATLDGATVALVFRPPTDDAQRVEAWSCDGSTLLASASVPRS